MKIEQALERPGSRKNSVYIGDTAFGDSGKGSVASKFNRFFVDNFGLVTSLKANGSANAGHHMVIDGVEFLANQLPSSVAQKHSLGIITRGMLLAPHDLYSEIERTKRTFWGEMPGELKIDERVPLALDTHRALDRLNGSTGRGVGPGYGDFYARKDLTLKDLLSDNWGAKFREHYFEKAQIFNALYQRDLANQEVAGLDNVKSRVGTVNEFLDKLVFDRDYLQRFATSNAKGLIQSIWQDERSPITIEESQGPGLDPYAGIRPDVTSSRPTSRNVHDGTWMVIFGENIALRLGVTKTTYMSSVGSRNLPGEMEKEDASWIQEEFGEKGKTTGRLRGIYHLSIPILRALKRFANYDFLVATHLDASRENNPIKYVYLYTDAANKTTQREYEPYQDRINELHPNYITMPGWDGEKTKTSREFFELPRNAKAVINLLSQKVAPVIMATTGPDLYDYFFVPTDSF